MSKSKIISLILGLLITGPIWYYLLYKILQLVNATELMWFLFWVYIPTLIVIQIIVKLSKDED